MASEGLELEVARACRIRDYRCFGELAMLISDKADDSKKTPAEIANAMVIAWENYKENMHFLRYQFGSPMSFFRSFIWDNEDRWPWDEDKIPKRRFEPGIWRGDN